MGRGVNISPHTSAFGTVRLACAPPRLHGRRKGPERTFMRRLPIFGTEEQNSFHLPAGKTFIISTWTVGIRVCLRKSLQ